MESGNGRHRGRVLWFSQEKGFGLIETSDGHSVVVDYPKIVPPEARMLPGEAHNDFRVLPPGCEVEVEVGTNGNGRRLAVKVRPIDIPESETNGRRP